MPLYSEYSAALAAPPKRRRRPALSCIQCRRRKVKCDQKNPCNQCQRSEGVICTFSSDQNANLSRQDLDPASSYQLPMRESTTATASTAHSPFSTVASRSTDSDLAENNAGNSRQPFSRETQGYGNDSRQYTDPVSFYTPDVERHVTDEESMPDQGLASRTIPLKAKLFGENHWMNHFTQFDKIASFMFDNERTGSSGEPSELYLDLQECKALGRTIKLQRNLQWPVVSDYKHTIPAKDVCDELVDNYFRTFESVYRIVHIPSFYASYLDYWTNSDENICCPRMILIMAIGTVFLPDSPKATSLRLLARQWVYAAQQWLSAPLEKSRMNIRGLQVQCLLILAREVIGIGSDLIWTAIGTLIRTAMQLGYHRDPRHFQGMSPLHAEIRRRLWATIIELGVQVAWSTALPPLIALDDFDTQPPLNINDSEISKNTTTSPIPHLSNIYTQTTVQIHILRSLPARLEVVRTTSSFRGEPTYDSVLRLSKEIIASCNFPFRSSHPQPTLFQLNHLEILLRNPLFALHRSYFIKAKTDHRFYYSRKVLLDAALVHNNLPQDDDWQRLLFVSPDFASNIATMYISLELIWGLEEESPGGKSAQAKLIRAPLIQSLKRSVESQLLRIKADENSVKGSLFLAALVAQIEAMERGENDEGVMKAIGEAAGSGIKECVGLLRAKVSMASVQDSDQGLIGEGTLNAAVDNSEASGGEYDFLVDMGNMDDIGMGMDFEVYNMEIGAFGNWNRGSWL